jgi:hypothetical protein
MSRHERDGSMHIRAATGQQLVSPETALAIYGLVAAVKLS